MKSLEEMEKSLHALMPAALSERGHQRISQQLRALAQADQTSITSSQAAEDSLAALALPEVSSSLSGRMPWHAETAVLEEEIVPVVAISNKKSLLRWAAAAAVVIGSFFAYLASPSFTSGPATLSQASSSIPSAQDNVILASNDAASPVLLDRVQLTDSLADEGTLTAADGSMLHQWKRRVQTRERYRDAQTGYLITISESRDEKVLVPKTSF